VDSKGALAAELPHTEDTAWRPEAAPEGPVSILITNEDRRIRVFRAGVEIGNAPFTLVDPNRKFTLTVLTLLERSAADPVSPAIGRPMPRWLAISGGQATTTTVDELLAVISVAPEFLRRAETVVGPGTTMVIVQPASTASTSTTRETDFTVMTGDK
jgi:hypothetical protein